MRSPRSGPGQQGHAPEHDEHDEHDELGSLGDAAIMALGEGRSLVLDRMLGADVAANVRAEALALHAAGRLRRAGVGRNADLHAETRGDWMEWIDPDNAPAALVPVVDLYAALLETLNATAYLGARRIEMQLAVYEPGAGYTRHRDALVGSTKRRATVIYYANPWVPGDGGELEVWEPDGVRIVEPIADRAVVFRSDVVEHAVREVLAGVRVAVSGWLRAD